MSREVKVTSFGLAPIKEEGKSYPIFGTTEITPKDIIKTALEKLRSEQYPITDHPPEVKTEISWEEVDNIVTKLGEK